MIDRDASAVTFVTASPGPGSADTRMVPLLLQDGRPPHLLTDPVPEHPGDWLYVEDAVDGFVYKRAVKGIGAP
jgi:hypothetical protein